MKYILIAFLLILCPLSFSSAQTDLSIANQGLDIDLKPQYPEPYSEFTASLNDYSVGNQVTGIKWRVDNAIITESNNERTITLKTKGINQKTTVEAIVTFSGGLTEIVKKTIAPTFIDIIIEPQTRTPSFYLGRSLPSIGSQINLTALVNGSTNNSGLVYTWKLNDTTLEKGSQLGKNKITTTIPFGTASIVTLEVSNLNDGSVYKRSVQIPTISPSLLFYEINPLYGQANKPVKNLNLIGDSVTVKAEPYNLDIITYNSPDMLEWKINGYTSTQGKGSPYEVTFARENGQTLSGVSRIDFHVRNLKQLLQGAEGGFQINF